MKMIASLEFYNACVPYEFHGQSLPTEEHPMDVKKKSRALMRLFITQWHLGSFNLPPKRIISQIAIL
jgi:hypothetical protein